LNPTPFSLQTKFLPVHAGEDKIDLELGGWEIHGIALGVEAEHGFKKRMGGPPKGSEDFAFSSPGKPQAPFGWFFTCPSTIGKDRNKLRIRQQALTHPTSNRRQEAPLCGGYCLFYRDKKAKDSSGKAVHSARLRLSLNMQRFTRHQANQDVPSGPATFRLQRCNKDRSTHGGEFSFDREDNWLPTSPAWRKFAKNVRIKDYLGLIEKRLEQDLKRACKYEDDPVEMLKHGRPYRLFAVETLWEFPSENPIGDVLQIGASLLHITRQGGQTKINDYAPKQAGRTLNSPCFLVPLAEGVKLKLYAKTNKRIRFEVVQTNISRNQSKIFKEMESIQEQSTASEIDAAWAKGKVPKISPLPALSGENWEELPAFLDLLRQRAAFHMNKIMGELREGKSPEVEACSVVELLAKVAAAAVSGLGKQERLSQIQTLLYFLCYQRGFRGSLKASPYARALEYLRDEGVIEYQPSRQFFTLAKRYVKAADTLVNATGEPLLSVFGRKSQAFNHPAKTNRRSRDDG
jgi:hypothetical protein